MRRIFLLGDVMYIDDEQTTQPTQTFFKRPNEKPRHSKVARLGCVATRIHVDVDVFKVLTFSR